MITKGVFFHGVTFDWCRFCTFLNSAQLASGAKFKNVQNLHQPNVTPWKKNPFKSSLISKVMINRKYQVPDVEKARFWSMWTFKGPPSQPML